ncbi:class I SAM-dependent methyltransferase [Nitrosococcus wardiae]|uniref:Class I SAM-dependent methyltransferase n=1 Tax=Nitrosococcus wardiae TaxID=1814290 RepID=A0A4P7C1X3_9GAMM|nr:class I SAM-dependent methyltransferase [Nitrosococcus wardiae]QBQ55640.1 class I SAM-dependent methyltransferase [Nitrosococcus wardiae]
MNTNHLQKSYQKAHIDWLLLRYPLDATARNRHLEAQALSQLSAGERLRVLDLGAGAGANVGYYCRLLPPPAQWWLVERDAGLLKQLPRFVKGVGEEEGNNIIPKAIHPVRGNFLDPNCPIYSHSFELVLANAVFDLLSADQFQRLLQLFRQAWGKPFPLFLFTLNLDRGLCFDPTDKETEYWCRRYEEHMHRPQHFGRAMAAHCGQWMEELFLEHGFKVESGPSVWEISPLQTGALLAKLDFFEKAMTAWMGTDTRQRNSFQQWLAQKRQQAYQQELSLLVPHRDVLARM